METQSNTKITSATIRVMRSLDFGNYETSLTIENSTGLNNDDFEATIIEANVLTDVSMNIYLTKKAEESKAIQNSEKKRIGSVLNDLKQLVPEKAETPVDAAEIAKVEALPMYEPKPKASISTRATAKKQKA